MSPRRDRFRVDTQPGASCKDFPVGRRRQLDDLERDERQELKRLVAAKKILVQVLLVFGRSFFGVWSSVILSSSFQQ